MKSPFTRFLAAASATMVVVGCGTSPVTGLSATTGTQLNSKSSAALRQGFEDIHKAIFDMVDRNKDGSIDEYEAGPYFNLRSEFPKADRGKAGAINYNEFMAYATKGGFLAGNDSPDKFLDRMRGFLDGAFKSFDSLPKRGWFDKGDGFLQAKELTQKNVKAAGLGFMYPKLHLDVKISGFKRDAFKAADKTGDGKLSQGEFEDLYIQTVVALIGKLGGKPGGGGGAPPADPGTPPSDPGAPPSNPPSNPPANPPGNGGGATPATRIGPDGKHVIVIDSDSWDAWEDLL
ncbi:MAG: hypothetical protein FJZ01_02335 [Candidatus Sericytochromatia bacterium]|nr:hypothetical protein [Candidatus Tanganyikabacteria bacterium]